MLYKPIYLVGYPHGGSTLFLNIFHQNRKIFSTGETHNRYYDELPGPLKNPEGRGSRGSCWRYGWNETIDEHHHTEKDVTPEYKKQYLDLLELIKKRKEATDDMRFFDKSVPYVIKTRYIQEILDSKDVYFLYLIKNPFVLCYKPFKYPDWYHDLKDKYERMTKSCEQVSNTYKYFLSDSKHLKHYKIVKFEDIVLKLKETVKDICNFLELDFDEEHMIHHPDRPFTSAKNLPLMKNTVHDDGTKDCVDKELDKIIAYKCADIIKKFDYSIPRQTN